MLVSEFIAGSAGPLAALQDPNSARFTADQRRGFVSDGVRELHLNHPETRVDANYTRKATPAGTMALTDTIPLSEVYLQPLAEYVMWLALANDSKDEGNREKAKGHLAAYTAFFSGEA